MRKIVHRDDQWLFRGMGLLRRSRRWQKLADKFGRKKLAEDLAAAIRTAQDGFPVPEWTAAYWASEVDYLRTDEAATKTYLPGDRAPKVGEVFRNPDLVWSLEQIAQH